MKKSFDIKKIAVISVLVAFSVVLSYFDRIISDGILTIAPILGLYQGFRIGLANIVILILILNFCFKDSLVAVILKSLLVGLFVVGSLSSFVIGISGTILSYFTMQLVCLLKKNKTRKTLIFISIIGGITHGLGQIAALLAFYPGIVSPIEIPGSVILGILSGAFVGVIVNSANYHLRHSYLIKYEKKSA